MSHREKILRTRGKDILMYSSVTVAQNEPVINEVMNRSLFELESNNVQLDTLNKLIFNELNITEYVKDNAYNVGDLIWYKDQNDITYLLRCIKQSNSDIPDTSQLFSSQYSKAGEERLNKSGWENLNRNLTILDYDVMSLVAETARSVIAEHEEDVEMHPYGKIDQLSDVLLMSDMSNIDVSRPSVFFPYQTIRMQSGIAVVTGYERNYGSIVEYDIILKLASQNIASYTDLFEDIKPLSANNITFELFSGVGNSSLQRQNNENYFATVADMDIFQPKGDGSSRCGIIRQNGRNDYVNTYSAKITFPRPFINLDYMVFSNTILSQSIGTNTMVPSANDIAYCDKTRQSITFLDITFPDSTKYGDVGWNSKNGGLVANSFHMKVIGQIGA